MSMNIERNICCFLFCSKPTKDFIKLTPYFFIILIMIQIPMRVFSLCFKTSFFYTTLINVIADVNILIFSVYMTVILKNDKNKCK